MNEKIKDKDKKIVVMAYQEMVKNAINDFVQKNDPLSKKQKLYIKGLKENVKNAPYRLGYLFPEETEDKNS